MIAREVSRRVHARIAPWPHPFDATCFCCGRRLGEHRYGDDACPNSHWRPGNGQPQWRAGWRFRAAR